MDHLFSLDSYLYIRIGDISIPCVILDRMNSQPIDSLFILGPKPRGAQLMHYIHLLLKIEWRSILSVYAELCIYAVYYPRVCGRRRILVKYVFKRVGIFHLVIYYYILSCTLIIWQIFIFHTIQVKHFSGFESGFLD